MRQRTVLWVIAALLAPAALATAQSPQLLPRQPHDVSAEYSGNTGPIDDQNGLPPPSESEPSLVLDAKARAFVPAVGSVHHNELIVPALFSDADGRQRSYLLPGLTSFHAWYGEFLDYDDDRTIDASGDASDEWTGYGPNETPGGMMAFVVPGYHPSTTSDYYVLAGILRADASTLEKEPDFEYVHSFDGNWTGSSTIPFVDGSLLEQTWVHTVANGVRAPTALHGYACADGEPRCRYDIDRYDVLDDTVSQLYAAFLAAVDSQTGETRRTVQEIYDTHAGPVADPLIDLAYGAATDSTGTAYRAFVPASVGKYRENDPESPYASMTAAHGAPRGFGGYDFASDWHAWLDVQPWNYYTEPNLVTLAASPLHIPGSDLKGKGLAPHFIGIQGVLGIYFDQDGDGAIDSGEMDGTCGLFDADGKPMNLTVTMEAVDDDGVPTNWGPVGAYVLREQHEGADFDFGPAGSYDVKWWDEAVFDLTDLTVHRLVTSGAIEIPMRCDKSDPGDWFSRTVVYLPMGTFGFHLRLSTPTGYVKFQPRGTEVTEAVRDVDLYERWD